MQEYILVLVTAVVAGALKFGHDWLSSKLKPQNMNAVIGFARDVVVAADQAGEKLGWSGADKYEYAETALVALAKRFGVKLKPEEVNSLIHAALKGVKEYETYSVDTVAAAIEAARNEGIDFGAQAVLGQLEQQQVAPDPEPQSEPFTDSESKAA